MNGMFAFCSLIKYIPVNNFNTCNVKNMAEMFFHCKGIKDLDLSNFNTDKVLDVKRMFSGCQKKLIKKIKKSYKNFEDSAFEKQKEELESIIFDNPSFSNDDSIEDSYL